MEQEGIPLLLSVFPGKAIPPCFGLKSQETWGTRRAPPSLCNSGEAGRLGEEENGPREMLNQAGNQSSHNLSRVSSGFISGTNWKCLSPTTEFVFSIERKEDSS